MPTKTTAPELTHAELRLLPVGFDNPDAATYVPPEQRAAYVTYAAAHAASLEATARDRGTMLVPTVDDRGRPTSESPPSHAVLVHTLILEGLKVEAAMTRRRAEWDAAEAEWQARAHHCEVCARYVPGRECEDYVIVGGAEVTRRGFGIAGPTVRAHPGCAVALERVLAERVDLERVRTFAATVPAL